MDHEEPKKPQKQALTAQPHHHHHHHRRHHWWRYFWLVIGLLAVVFAITLGAAWRNIKQASDKIYSPVTVKQTNGRSSIGTLLKHKQPINILLLGTDTGALGRDYKGRTDTIMMMVVNPTTKKTTIVSLPRDMKVNLPGYAAYSPAKVNAAYTYGGVSETIKTLNQYFEVPIDSYLLINMGGLEKAIDHVGGVDVTSPLTFSYEGHNFTKNKTEHMDGETALAFSRMRYQDPNNDYGRQERQRLVIMALLKKSVSYQTLLNQTFLDSLASQVQTNFTLGQMTTLALDYREATKNVTTDHAQGSGQALGGVDFEVVGQGERQRVSDKLRLALQLKEVNLKETE